MGADCRGRVISLTSPTGVQTTISFLSVRPPERPICCAMFAIEWRRWGWKHRVAQAALASATPCRFALPRHTDGNTMQSALCGVQACHAAFPIVPAAPIFLSYGPPPGPILEAPFAIIASSILVFTTPTLLLLRPYARPLQSCDAVEARIGRGGRRCVATVSTMKATPSLLPGTPTAHLVRKSGVAVVGVGLPAPFALALATILLLAV